VELALRTAARTLISRSRGLQSERESRETRTRDHCSPLSFGLGSYRAYRPNGHLLSKRTTIKQLLRGELPRYSRSYLRSRRRIKLEAFRGTRASRFARANFNDDSGKLRGIRLARDRTNLLSGLYPGVCSCAALYRRACSAAMFTPLTCCWSSAGSSPRAGDGFVAHATPRCHTRAPSSYIARIRRGSSVATLVPLSSIRTGDPVSEYRSEVSCD